MNQKFHFFKKIKIFNFSNSFLKKSKFSNFLKNQNFCGTKRVQRSDCSIFFLIREKICYLVGENFKKCWLGESVTVFNVIFAFWQKFCLNIVLEFYWASISDFFWYFRKERIFFKGSIYDLIYNLSIFSNF